VKLEGAISVCDQGKLLKDIAVTKAFGTQMSVKTE
jgi:hypothetical protein